MSALICRPTLKILTGYCQPYPRVLKDGGIDVGWVQGVLPTQVAETGGAQAEERPVAGEQDTQVRGLEVQIDALYGVHPNNAAPRVPSPFQTVQQPGVCALCLWLSMEVVADGYFMSGDVFLK
jgi:hypothetical protein